MFTFKKILINLSQQRYLLSVPAKSYFSKSGSQDKKDVQEVLSLIQPEWKGYVTAGIVSILSSAVLMLIPKAIPQFSKLYDKQIDKISDQDTQQEKALKQKEFDEMKSKYSEFLLRWALICTASGVLNYSRRFMNLDLSNRVAVRLRNQIYQDLISQQVGFFYQKGTNTANFIHKLSNDVTAIANGLSSELFFGVRGLLLIFGGATYIALKAQALILPALFIMAGMSISSKILGQQQRDNKVEETAALTRTSELAAERLGSIKLIKLSNTQEIEQQSYMQALTKFYRQSRQVSHYTGMNFGFMQGFGFFSLIGILSYGSYLVTLGQADPQMLTSSIYAIYMGMGFRAAVNSYTELKKTVGLYEGIKELIGPIHDDPVYNNPNLFQMTEEDSKQRISELLQKNKEDKKKEDDHWTVLEKAPSIEFKNVNFQYTEYGVHRQLLASVNIKIEAGNIAVLVGPSGCGKSTILNLLTKLYSPTEGQILINQHSLTNKETDWIQKNISFVTQDPILFMGSVYDNIIYGNHGFDISLENVIRASKIAKAHQFIERMPDGYNTHLAERGQNLSGGQKQRIIIARALLKNPSILLLDEATAHLDPESQKNLINDLKEICRNRTCIVVTHQIDNYKNFVNQIIELKPTEQVVKN